MSRTDAEIAEAMAEEATAETEIEKRDRKVTGGNLLNAAELHRMARAKETPPEFQSARRLLDEAANVEAERRDEMHDLIRAAHEQGVGPAVLARWSGYAPSRIYQILDEE